MSFLGVPGSKEIKELVDGFVTDEDRQRWGTLTDPNKKGFGSEMMERVSKPGMEMANRPLQAQMMAAEHDNFRRNTQQEPAAEQRNEDGSAKQNFDDAGRDVAADGNTEKQQESEEKSETAQERISAALGAKIAANVRTEQPQADAEGPVMR